jgi:hypothetical protein
MDPAGRQLNGDGALVGGRDVEDPQAHSVRRLDGDRAVRFLERGGTGFVSIIEPEQNDCRGTGGPVGPVGPVGLLGHAVSPEKPKGPNGPLAGETETL